jgi:acylphosphatase
VEVLAQGPRESLEQLLTFLHHGPPAASVTRVGSQWRPLQAPISGFRIVE